MKISYTNYGDKKDTNFQKIILQKFTERDRTNDKPSRSPKKTFLRNQKFLPLPRCLTLGIALRENSFQLDYRERRNKITASRLAGATTAVSLLSLEPQQCEQ